MALVVIKALSIEKHESSRILPECYQVSAGKQSVVNVEPAGNMCSRRAMNKKKKRRHFIFCTQPSLSGVGTKRQLLTLFG